MKRNQSCLLMVAVFAALCATTGSAQEKRDEPSISSDAYFQAKKRDVLVDVTPDKTSIETHSESSTSTSLSENPNAAQFEPSQVVALVGGEPIFLGDMLPEINATIDQFLENAPPDVREREAEKAIPMLIERFIPKYVDTRLLYLDAVGQLPDGAKLDDILKQAGQDFDDKALPKILEKSKLRSPLEYDAQLRSRGSSLRKMRETWAKEQLTGYFVNQQLKYDKDITHDELLKYYNAHLEEYEVQAQVKWEELMVRFDRFDSRDQAYKAIVAMGNEVVYGAKLDAVAKRSSQGLTSSQGGQYDWTKRGALVDKGLEDALFSLPLNELSDFIETQQGVHIVRVLERKEDGKIPFLEAQAGIKETLIEENRNQAFEEHLIHLRKEIPHEIVWKSK